MVDVSSKEDTNRIAIATGNIFAEHKTLVLIKEGTPRKEMFLALQGCCNTSNKENK